MWTVSGYMRVINKILLRKKQYLTIINKVLKTHKNLLTAGVLCAVLICAGAGTLHAELSEQVTAASVDRRAQRLSLRLEKRGVDTDLQTLTTAVQWKQAISKRETELVVVSDDGKVLERWTVSLSMFPAWMRPVNDDESGEFQFVMDPTVIAADVSSLIAKVAPLPQDVTVTAVEAIDGIERAQVSGIARAGYDFDAASAARDIAQALDTGEPSVRIGLRYREPVVTNNSGRELGDLRLLAGGLSDFGGSGAGRKVNVRKGLADRLDGVIVQPGATFSFNDMLGTVSLSDGWQMAYVIFNGGELRSAPGGGICQVATTLYRAVLQAGFPVIRRANHSLFVTYYEKHGVGMDATIYPGKQDFSFVNDTAHPILIQAFSEGDTAQVNIYGTADGRKTVLEGPYFAASQPKGSLDGRVLRSNEIGWLQRVTKTGEAERRSVFVSRYSGMPRSLATKYPVATIQVRHTPAPSAL